MAGRLEITERRIGNVIILQLSGPLSLDDDDLSFRKRIEALDQGQPLNLILDFRDVPSIDSGGIGTLAAKYLSVRRRGGDIKLLNLTERTRRVMAITRLLTVFEVFDSETQAVESFSAQVPTGAGRSNP